VAQASPGDSSLEQLITRADEVLYRAKEHGRNRVALAESASA
jgi:PleD family two-component response regulator